MTTTDLHNLHAQRALRAQSMLQEQPRGKKGLPFLKNPMSTLLARRKTSQNMPDLALQLRNYEPIRGNRVHDFSAPRPKRVVSTSDVGALAAYQPENAHVLPTSPEIPEAPEVPAPPVPPKDEHGQSLRASTSTHSRAMSADAVSFRRAPTLSTDFSHDNSITVIAEEGRNGSVPPSIAPVSRNASASLSRNVSDMSNKDVISSLPKHMKSTSSRFSFDMIGAARAEKLLEERHRQRQQDKQDQESIPSSGQRDSRFDDYDEEPFEYDDMDFDDGLEEKIPGVNADYDEEDLEAEMDLDNDQENFAGFVFQRSKPTSTVTSPQSLGMQLTPRDSTGQIIGFAMTKETPDLRWDSQFFSDSQLQASPRPSPLGSPTGLGIQGLDAAVEASSQIPSQQEEKAPKPLKPDDEFYFVAHSFEGEGDGTAFDESIFDLDDTDQYGRPIPGMFANALAQRTAAQEGEGHRNRESDDATSRLSAQSGLSQSTAHTSLSVGLQHKVAAESEDETKTPPREAEPSMSGIPTAEHDGMAVYQAALAAAAHKAAASGKFRRDSDPEPPQTPADPIVTSPTTVGSDPSDNHLEVLNDYENDYDNDGFSNGLDDYELDDDAIIAEANASALANDYDGWYGQEFNFYAGPTVQPHHASNNQLSEQNMYQYSNGGYFVPSGVARTKSGHLVSREPNLTPITERSEYSNRNSIMSFTMPNSANREGPLQSPGLAQLAMMADDDNMSLSALLRLRSKAWGGSQASLVSSREGSPSDRNGAISPWGQEREPLVTNTGHTRKNSAFSLWSESGAGSGSGSPTLTMSMPNVQPGTILPLPVSPNANSNVANSPAIPSSFPPVLEDEEPEGSNGTADRSGTLKSAPGPISPVVGVASQKRPGMGHRHKGSADSISYTKEDESGETRWVMERRRTAESGEIEILSRDIVEGGKI